MVDIVTARSLAAVAMRANEKGMASLITIDLERLDVCEQS